MAIQLNGKKKKEERNGGREEGMEGEKNVTPFPVVNSRPTSYIK